MIRTFCIIILLLWAAPLSAKTEQYSYDSIAQLLTEQIENMDAVTSVVREGTDMLKVNLANGGEVSVFLGNLKAELELDPQSEQETLARFLSVFSSQMLAEEETPASSPDQLLPIVRSEDYVQHLQETLSTAEDKVAARRIAADYWLLLALDDEHSLKVATAQATADFNMNDDETYARAIANLNQKLLPLLEVHEYEGLHMALIDGTYESSLIAVDSYWKQESERLQDVIVAVAPSRDVLLYCAKSNAPCVSKIEHFARENIPALSGSISVRLIEWEGAWKAYHH